MFKKRFLQGLVAGSILLASLMTSSFTLTASPASRGTTDSRAPQHATWAAQFSPQYHLDCFRRTYNFGRTQSSNSAQQDASNYFLNMS